MRCEVCGNGDRRPGRKPYVAQKDGRVAVVTDVPVEECPACGEVWFEVMHLVIVMSRGHAFACTLTTATRCG